MRQFAVLLFQNLQTEISAGIVHDVDSVAIYTDILGRKSRFRGLGNIFVGDDAGEWCSLRSILILFFQYR